MGNRTNQTAEGYGMESIAAVAERSRQLPWRTLVLVAGGGLVYLLPGAAEHLIYNRPAILSGEIWRLITGHWVHYTPGHLGYNLLALAMAGAIIELQDNRHLLHICGVSALVIGLSLLVFRPDLYYFAGASGVATAAVAYCALSGLSTPGLWRALCLAVLLLLVGKISFELLQPGPSLVGVSGDFVVVPLSHAIGAASSLFLFSWWKWRDSRASQGTEKTDAQAETKKIVALD